MTSVDVSDTPESAETYSDAADRAYFQVLSMITSGELGAGARVPEKALAEMAGVSRTPVRQALNRLGAEGVVELSKNRGAQVVSFSPEDIAALYEVRAQLEPQAVRLAVPRLSSEDLSELVRLSTEMEAVVGNESSPERLTLLNTSFHGVFLDRCGNRHLSSALHAVMRPAIVTRTFRQYNDRALKRSMLHHAELVEAAETGDSEWAEAIMRAHILSARHVVDNRSLIPPST